MNEQIIRLPAVRERTGLARTSIYTAIAAGTFPAPVRLGKRSVGWRAADVNAWIASRVSTRATP